MNDRIIARTIIRDHLVSTVKLAGFDNGEIDAYETMVFKVGPPNEAIVGTELDVQRYGMREDAVVGHYVMVGRWREILFPSEICFQCGEPTSGDTIKDEDIHGNIGDRPVCRPCRFDMFGKDNEEY